MATKKRLIDAYKLEDLVRRNRASYHNKDDVIAAIAGQPSVDAVEVVRCKGCKLEGTEKCPMVHRDLLFGNLYAETKPDAFCSYGERRTDETLQKLP